MQKSLLITVLFACFAQAIIAQETIKGLSNMPAKEFSKYEEKINIVKSSGEPYKMGQGQVAYYPALAIPKKVAVINFYVYDMGTTHWDINWAPFKYSGYAGGLDPNRADEEANTLYTYFHNSLIDSSKAWHGIEVITPEKFTEAQKATYESHIAKTSAFFSKFLSKEDNAWALDNASGFKDYYMFQEADYKMGASYGELATALGVDAVLVVKNEVSSDKTETVLKKIGMYLYGPNPVPKIEGQKYFGLMGAAHHTGVYYGGIAYVFGKKGIPYCRPATKKKALWVEFDGLSTVYNRMLKNMWYDLIVTNKCGQAKK